MNKMLSSIALLAITGNVLMAGGDIVPVEPVVVEETVSDEWKYHASINGWLPDINIDTAGGDSINFKLKDILKNLNMTVMGTLGAQKGKWGFLTDVVYLNMSKGTFKPETPSVVLTNLKMKAWIVTPMATYRFMESENLSLDVLAGARYLNISAPVQINYIETVDSKGHSWDGIVGLKGKYDFNEKWFMPFLFDVGTGEIDLTWQAFAGVGYKFENWDMIAGYRYLKWEYDDNDDAGDEFDDITVNGPIIGFKYHF